MKVRPLQFIAYALLTVYSILVALPLVWMVLSSTREQARTLYRSFRAAC